MIIVCLPLIWLWRGPFVPSSYTLRLLPTRRQVCEARAAERFPGTYRQLTALNPGSVAELRCVLVPAFCRADCAGRWHLVGERDAIAHLGKTIPKSDHDMPTVVTAAELLTLAAEQDGPVEFARIATLRALNRHAVRTFNSDHKGTHWGHRKLKRDTASS
jgi:hypothetical protein